METSFNSSFHSSSTSSSSDLLVVRISCQSKNRFLRLLIILSSSSATTLLCLLLHYRVLLHISIQISITSSSSSFSSYDGNHNHNNNPQSQKPAGGGGSGGGVVGFEVITEEQQSNPMGKRRLYKCKHPIDALPFEAYYEDSWKIVRSVKIDGGNVTMHIRHHDDDDDDDDEFEFESEEKVPIGNLRLKSRKAVVSDCTCFLRPGIDICVLVTFTNEAGSSSSDEEDGSTEQTAWIDAKINSIERKPHKLGCDCRFFVNFYTTYQPNGGMGQSKPEKEITEVTIDNVFILQQLERKPCEDGYYRWCSSEDCSSTAEAKLYRGQFSYDISWFLVTSTLKGFKFKIISTQKKMVYQLDDCSLSSENVLKAINFQREDGAMKANIRTFVPEVPIKTSTPTNTTKLELHDDLKEKDICDLALYDLVELRRSNRRNVQPERFSGYGFPKPKSSGLKRCKLEIPSGVPYGVDECVEQKIQGEKTDDARCFSMQNEQKVQNSSRDCADSKPTPVVTLPMSGSPTGLHLQDLPCDEVVVNHLPKISKIPSQHGVRSDQAIQMMKILGRKCRKLKNRLKEKATHNKLRSKSVSFSFKRKQSDDSGRTYERKNLCSSECVKVIDSFMKSIKADIVKDQPTSVFHWETIRETVPSNRWRDLFRKLPEDDQIQGDELEDLWKEMEVSTNVLRGLEETPLLHAEESNEKVEQSCQHEPELDEEIGIICQLCGSVITEIRYVSLPFLQSNGLVREREQRDESKFGFSHVGDDNLNLFGNLSSPKNDISVHKENDTVWALIPDLKNSLQIHQKKAFEFLWRHIAGSLIPAEMESMYTKTGGCVISHSPGAGKTFLVISFLVSSLRLFPRKRPLILAPNTTLYAWEKEIKKWEVSFPVYQIYTEKNYQDKKRSQIVSESPGHRRLTRVMMHAIDCLDKLRRWHEGPSILLMSYSSFHAFMREKSKLEHWRYMTRVLQQSPGILILDEGHNPRSTKSLTRKELMKVKTGHRILLSGTLFQNTFEEFFNTLCLARPSFISEVLRELDPRYRIGKKGMNNSREKRARKFFLENIAQRINSKVEKDRDRGLSLLKKLTNDFVDVYEGAVSDRLPGLEAYTLLIKPTVTQNEVLSKLQRKSSDKRYQIEMEILITVASIHPSLIKKLAYVSKYLSVDELEELEKLQSDVKKGSKVRFVLNLVQRCVIRKEKVLIFCRNLSPMNLLVEIFENIFGWKKGDDVLVMHGDQNLLERATVIDKFEERYGVSKVLVASIAACSEGISLTAASRVVLLDSEWNPSKTKQAVARAYRPGQEKVVYVYQLLSSGTMEEEKYRKTAWKTWVSRMIFEGNDVEESSRRKAENIDDDVLREIVEEDETKSIHMIIKDDKLYNGSNQGWN